MTAHCSLTVLATSCQVEISLVRFSIIKSTKMGLREENHERIDLSPSFTEISLFLLSQLLTIHQDTIIYYCTEHLPVLY